jgi:serine phosphatase RsbU (regulator of sigma subunit)
MQYQGVKILLIEDDPDDVWILRSLLGDRWDGPLDMVNVELLSSALEACRRDRFDVLLLDLSLPDSQGLETFLQLYAQAGDIPIVVITGLADERTAIKAVQAGAQDYLIKGQVDDNLLIRPLRYAIERSRRDRAERELRATSEEFRIAQKIQQRLFPTEAPCLPGFDIAGAVYPATATAGDYFDYIPLRGDCLGIVVGDVSSHGMGPALVMAETRSCLRTLAQSHDDVGEMLTRANRLLACDSDDLHYVTLALARLEPKTRRMTYASAGQRGYLFDAAGNVQALDATSAPLGIDKEMCVPVAPAVILEPGQMLVFFTDGVVEAESHGHARFGVPRVMQLIRSERDKPAAQIVAAIYQAVCDFRGHGSQLDDITAVVVKVLPEAAKQ